MLSSIQLIAKTPTSAPINGRQPRFKWAFRVLFIGYWVALFLATHLPIPRPIQEEVAGLDKYIHAGAYFVLTGLLVLWNGWPYRLTFSRLLTIALLIAIYAVFDEWLQSKVDRFADVKDWLADLFGGFCALGLAALVQPCFRRHSSTTREDGPFGL